MICNHDLNKAKIMIEWSWRDGSKVRRITSLGKDRNLVPNTQNG